MKECPYCKTENHDDAIVCRACRNKITQAAITSEVLAKGIESCGCLLMIVVAIIGIIVAFLCK